MHVSSGIIYLIFFDRDSLKLIDQNIYSLKINLLFIVYFYKHYLDNGLKFINILTILNIIVLNKYLLQVIILIKKQIFINLVKKCVFFMFKCLHVNPRNID